MMSNKQSCENKTLDLTLQEQLNMAINNEMKIKAAAKTNRNTNNLTKMIRKEMLDFLHQVWFDSISVRIFFFFLTYKVFNQVLTAFTVETHVILSSNIMINTKIELFNE